MQFHNYNKFLKTKELNSIQKGINVSESKLNKVLYDFQKFCVSWALSKGKAAIFSDCGTGKTLMQLEWANHIIKKTKRPVLLLTPLAVAEQTLEESKKLKIKNIQIVEEQKDVHLQKINITNYEKLHKFRSGVFIGIVLDESGILKNHSGMYRNSIINFSQNITYRLACTATPAPNDYMELTNHAEYLGIQSRTEVLSTYFVHDSGDTGKWRLKGHVKDNIFWQWLSNWAVMFSQPTDLGFKNDPSFKLPEIEYHQHFVKSSIPVKKGKLFHVPVTDLTDRRKVRSNSVQSRCEKAAKLINENDDSWLIWCGLNTESTLMTKLVNNAFEVTGSQKDEIKKERMLGFANGEITRLVTKPKIAGHGLNLQICNNMAFIGLNDSWEQLYQAIRREWRFGQKEKVDVHFFLDEREGPVLSNLMRKEQQALDMQKNMINIFKKLMKKNVSSFSEYKANKKIKIPKWMKG